MANESPLLRDGAQTIAGADYRNSTLSGTTHSAMYGSAQYQAVHLSSGAVDRTVFLTTVNGQPVYGILQNKPGLGEVADIGIFGVSKAVAGATFGPGVRLMADSSGCLIAYASAAGVASCGVSLETVAAAGQIFTASIYGLNAGPGSIA